HRMVALHDRKLAKVSAAGRGEAGCTDVRNPLAGEVMIDILLRDLRQPEYIHVLINPLPIYGLLMGWIGLVIALLLKSRQAQVATLALVLISSALAWPVFEFGEQAYDCVQNMTDSGGHAWVDVHKYSAEDVIQ